MSAEVRDVPQLGGVRAPARLPEQTQVGAVHLQIGDLQFVLSLTWLSR